MRIVRDNEESGNNLEKHFRELRNLETVPSSNLWDNLEDRLNEDRERVKHDHWYKALILLLIPFTVINILLSYDLEGYYKNITGLSKENSLEQPAQTIQQAIPNDLNKSGGWGNFFNEGFLSPAYATETPTNLGNTLTAEIIDAIFSNNSLKDSDASDATTETVKPEQLSSLHRQMLETSATEIDVVKYHSRNVVNEGVGSVKGFHIGIEGGVNNSWLLHKDNTLNPVIGNRIHRKYNLGTTYGISAGYDFSKRYGIEAEWIIQSQQGQDYWELRYGKILINGEVNLDYMHVPVMFKYKWTKLSSRSLQPRVVNLVTGIQYSRLMDAHVVQNGLDLEKVSELFNRDELGLLLGAEYDIYVNKNFYMSVGARASISTDARAFPYFNSDDTETYNVLIGLNASFNYLATRRKKS